MTKRRNQKPDQNNQPDYIARQYRMVRTDNGWQTRKERIGVAWEGDNGFICFRPAGQQLIEGDVYFYPNE